MVAEMRELYWDVGDGLDLNSPDMPAAGPEELGPPGGAFVVGYREIDNFNGNPVATFFGEKRLSG